MADNIKAASRSIYIDSSSAENALENLQRANTKLTEKIEKARLEQAKLLQKITENENAGKSIGRLEAQYAKLGKTVNTLTDQQEKNAKAQKEVTTQINEGLRPSIIQVEAQVTKLRNSLRRMSEDAPGYAEKFQSFRAASSELDRMRASLSGVERAQNSWMNQAKTVAFGVLIGNTVQSAVQAISGYISGIVSGNAKLSDSLAQVEKATGLTSGQVGDLNSQLSKIDTRTSTADLREIAIGLGQLGEAATAANIAAIDQIVVALGDEFGGGAKEITTSLSILRNNLQDLKTGNYGEDIGRLGNALNVLGAEGLATAPVVTDFANRMAGIAGTFKLTSGEILGTAATFQELGINVERGSTAFTRILQKIAAEPEKFAKVAGLSIKEFTNLVNNDMLAAFSRVAEGAKKAGASNVVFAKILKELDADGSGAGEVLSKVARNAELLKTKVDLASGALTNTNSITQEFSKVNNNLAADLEKLGKVISRIFANSTLSTVLGNIVKSLTGLLSPAKDARAELDTFALTVNNLQKDAIPLIERVEQLSKKSEELGGTSKLSKEEQVELNKAINAIAGSIPFAITQWDEYGNAIAISTDKARDFINLQQNILKERNRNQIAQYTDQLKELNLQLIGYQKTIAFVTSSDPRNRQSDTFIRGYAKTEAEFIAGQTRRANYIKSINDLITAVQARIQGVQGNIDELSGKALDKDLEAKQAAAARAKAELDAGNGTGSNPFGGGNDDAAAKKAAAEREKLLKEYNDFIKALNLSINDLLIPEASKKIIAILRQAQDETAKLNELRRKGAISDLQLKKDLALVDEKRSLAIRELLADEEKTFVKPINQSTLSALRTDGDKLPVQLIPEIDPADLVGNDGLLKKIGDILRRNRKAGFDLDVLNANNPVEKRNALLARLKEEHDLEMANKNLTDNERLVLEKEYQNKVAQINKDAVDALLAHFTTALGIASQVVNTLQQFADRTTNLENAALQRELKQNETRKQNIKKLQDSKVISNQEALRRITAIEREEDKKKEELERKQFERQKKLSIAQAAINGALAITNIWATTPKVDFGVSTYIMLGLNALATIGSIAAISSRKFAKGGLVMPENVPAGKITTAQNIPTQPNGDNVLATVRVGEVVLNEDQQRRAGGAAFFSALGVPGFAGGGRIQPFWKTRPYVSLNYPEIVRQTRLVQLAGGGLVSQQATQQSTQATPITVQMPGSERQEQLLELLIQTLQQPIQAEVSLNKLESATAQRDRIKKNSGG